MSKEIRLGVYVCHCGVNIAGVVDVKKVAEYASKLKNVVISRDYKYMCSAPGQELIKKDIKEHKLNRIVVAACSPRLHEQTFRKALQEAGLNPFLVEMANIREHCSWVHMNDKEIATEKAKDLLRMAVAKARLLKPLNPIKVPVKNKALVIGGGVAGIEAALDLADMGYEVYLVEKSPSIGGHMAMLDKTFPTMDCSACILTPKMVDAARHPNIKLITYAEVKEIKGYVGNFKVKILKKPRYVLEDKCTGCGLCSEVCPIEVPNEFDQGLGVRKAIYVPFPQAVPLVYTIDKDYCIGCGNCKAVCGAKAIDFEQKPEEIELEVGTIIVATGYKTFDARKIEEYGYGRYQNVITALEFERLINASGPTAGKLIRPSDGKEPKRLAFILCVGSRDERFNKYCSRVCCMYSIKNARLYKEKHPDADVYIFYMDIRASGKGYEEFYKKSQEEYGIKFVRGKPSEIKEDSKTKNLIVVVEDTLLGKKLEFEFDLVVLAVGLEPREDSKELARMLRISVGEDGFFLESHPKLKPVESVTDGIFLAGCCLGPKDIPESVAQASAAAAKAAALMSRKEIEVEPIIAKVNKEKCIGCRLCMQVCDFKAINIVNRKAEVNPALCKGCGACSGACPTGAIQVNNFMDDQIFAMLDALFDEEKEFKGVEVEKKVLKH